MTRRHAASLLASGLLTLAACGGGGTPPPPALTGARAVSVGKENACAALTDGTAVCWGSNSFGALGDGTSDAWLGPAAVNLGGVETVQTGDLRSCATNAAGDVWCWGSNVFGELASGPPTLNDHPTPVKATGISGPTARLASGRNHDVCAVPTGGSVECWGVDVFGLAPPSTTIGSLPPTADPRLTEVRALALGSFFGCALHADGTVSCWGTGALGQPDGNNVLSVSATPVTVAGLTGVVELTAGEQHVCARLTDGTVECWGSVALGIGRGSGTPVRVDELAGAVSLAAGGLSTCAVLSDGAVRCVGVLGRTDGANILGVAHATSVGVGAVSACAVISDGTIKCWGEGFPGLLGDGKLSDEMTMTMLDLGPAVTVVAPGAAHPTR